MKHFAVMWILTVIGALIAIILPMWTVVTLSIVCIGLLVLIYLTKLANVILYYVIPLFMGVFHFLLITLFIGWLGKALVLSVFIGTVIIFLLLAFLGLKLISEITDTAIYAIAVLIVFVVFAFIYIFIPISSTIILILAGLFVLLFAIYTVYDLNNIRKTFARDNEVIAIALGLYLNFLNVFFNLVEVTKKRR
ncbi:Bax inhibitor-1 family protein [Ureibacillus xyleni]|uniref:Bax inhibitor-1 family protein n=1 Tax=Ureibacillus xyleni TaxID=614648 RepID=UPI00137A1268|nr:Bax inhibitor-1 family protein [Ureibacillus xyleni]